MKGPRVFALVVLLALAFLPRTGWVVRNDVDLLAGKWRSFGAEYGWSSAVGPVPGWPFEPRNLDDPVARALAPDRLGNPNPTYQQRWTAAQGALNDPALRPKIRGPYLRRFFTAAVVHVDRPAFEDQKAFARTLMPLALEGEKADPQNAFYPSSAWCLLTILGKQEEARNALRRASLCARYDDLSFAEEKAFVAGFEGQYGYRGSLLRVVEGAGILMPQFTSMRNASERLIAATPLGDPSRRDMARLGVTMVRTSPTLIGAVSGRAMFLRAIGASEKKGIPAPRAFAAFRTSNPGFEDREALALVERVRDLDRFLDTDESVLSPWTPTAGAIALLALLGGLAAWPVKAEEPATQAKRVRRAVWSGLGFVSLGLYQGPASFGAVFLFLPFVLFGASLWLPTWGRTPLWVATIGLVSGLAVAGSHPDPVASILSLAVYLLILRLTLPIRRGAEWIAAIFATLYLASVVAELRSDAQIAEVWRQVETEAPRFRAERGIR